jgi:hypothetical protein
LKIKRISIFLCVVMIAAVFAAGVPLNVGAEEDTTPPVLVEFSFTPTTIDVSAGPAVVTYTLRITDDLSGFVHGYVGVFSPSGQQDQGRYIYSHHRISGDELDGIYEVTVTFPQNSEAGTWNADNLYIQDNVRNTREIKTADLIAEGFPVEITVEGGPDLAPPELVEFDFSPTSIDVSGGSQNVIFTLRITDEISGFDHGYVGIFSPSGQQDQGRYIYSHHRISGDEFDGIYEVTVTFPQYSEAGTWNADNLYIKDNVRNTRKIRTADLIAEGFPVELDVFSDPDDLIPPELVEFDFTPTTIDVSSGPADVTFTLRITDDLSGFVHGYVGIFSPSGQQNQGRYIYSHHRISGDEFDGIYEVTVTFPQYSEAGTWNVDKLYTLDNVRNTRRIRTADLIADGFPTELEVSVFNPEDAIEDIDDYVREVPESAFSNNAEQRKNALYEKLIENEEGNAVLQLIEAGHYEQALKKLQHDIRPKCDGSVGGNPNNDWITDPEVQGELIAMIDALIDYLESLLEE